MGEEASAAGLQAIAIGDRSSANADNSVAIGAGVSTTRANQVAVGSESSTYTLAGVSSTASQTAQSGPTELVTADANGNLATIDGATFLDARFNGALSAQNARIDAQGRRIDSNADDIEENRAGIAIALAMESPYVPANATFALSGGFGYYENESAFAFATSYRASPSFVLSAGVGSGLNEKTVGARVGAQYSW